MNTSRFSFFLATLCAALLTACPETVVPSGFGEGTVILEPAIWEGTWHEAAKVGDAGFTFTVNPDLDGQLTAQGLSKGDRPLHVSIRRMGSEESKMAFLTYKGTEHPAASPLSLVSIPKDGVFLLWRPNYSEIEKAIRAGELIGAVGSGENDNHRHCSLEACEKNYSKLVESRFWEWGKAVTYVRSSRTARTPEP